MKCSLYGARRLGKRNLNNTYDRLLPTQVSRPAAINNIPSILRKISIPISSTHPDTHLLLDRANFDLYLR